MPGIKIPCSYEYYMVIQPKKLVASLRWEQEQPKCAGKAYDPKISNTNRILIFHTPKVHQFVFYIQFCPKLSQLSMIFSKATKLLQKRTNSSMKAIIDNCHFVKDGFLIKLAMKH